MFGKPNAKRVSWSNASANLSYHPTEFIENNQCKMVRKLVAQVKFSYMKHLTTEKCHQPYIAMEMFKPNPASKLDKKICHWFQTQHLFPLHFKTSLVTKKLKSDITSPNHSQMDCQCLIELLSIFTPVNQQLSTKFTSLSSPALISSAFSMQFWLSFLRRYFEVLGQPITTLTNLSLSERSFPSFHSHVAVRPLLKKASLNNDNPSNYRPI